MASVSARAKKALPSIKFAEYDRAFCTPEERCIVAGGGLEALIYITGDKFSVTLGITEKRVSANGKKRLPIERIGSPPGEGARQFSAFNNRATVLVVAAVF